MFSIEFDQRDGGWWLWIADPKEGKDEKVQRFDNPNEAHWAVSDRSTFYEAWDKFPDRSLFPPELARWDQKTS